MQRKVRLSLRPPTSLSRDGPIIAKQREGESSEKTGLCFELQPTATCLFDTSPWMAQRHLELIMFQTGHFSVSSSQNLLLHISTLRKLAQGHPWWSSG